jgi:hypothetical protein
MDAQQVVNNIARFVAMLATPTQKQVAAQH